MTGANPTVQLRATLARGMVNTPARVLANADSLRLDLSTAQLIRLQEMADSLQAAMDRTAERIVELAPSSGATDSLRSALLVEARKEILRGVDMSKAVLSGAQWERLPNSIRKPRENPLAFEQTIRAR